MGTDGLVTLIRAAPKISLTVVSDKDSLVRALERGAYSVLIVQAGASSDADYQSYLALQPDMAIVVLDVDGEETVVRLRDVGRDALLKLIETVSDIRQGSAGERGRVHLLKHEDVERIARNGLISAPTLVYADPGLHLDDVKRWLDLSLGYRLAITARDESDIGQPAIRGWGMDTAQARALLGEEVATATTEELRAKREAHETRMREREAAGRAFGRHPPLLYIADIFELDSLETFLLWHCLAPELDGRYARIYGVLNDDMTRRRPTLSRLAELLGDPGLAWKLRRHLAGPRPFARHRLISIQSEQPSPGWPATEESVVPAPEIARRCQPRHQCRLRRFRGSRAGRPRSEKHQRQADRVALASDAAEPHDRQ